MKRIKVLLIQSRIPPYRIPIYNKLAEHMELTILYETGNEPSNVNFCVKKVGVSNIKYFRKLHRCNILKYVRGFDAVIMMLDPSYLTTHILVRSINKIPVILWGIGVAAAYDMRYDGCQKTAAVLYKLIKKSDASLFYSDYPVRKYIDMGISKEKLFVANNTVQVNDFVQQEKKEILFVGTLYKAKKIFELLQNYENAFRKNMQVPNLTIVGDGEEFHTVEKWILEHRLSDKIKLAGAIFEEEVLSTYFAKAFMCISPDQAGLSVLKSMGYGVPFVTHVDAITGGERFNITHNETGILFEHFDEIEDIILDCAENQSKYIEMGKKAYKFYLENRTVDNMVAGFLQAIEYLKIRD